MYTMYLHQTTRIPGGFRTCRKISVSIKQASCRISWKPAFSPEHLAPPQRRIV